MEITKKKSRPPSADKTEVAVRCAYGKMADTAKLKPNSANPNTHPDVQIERLALLIKEHGWRHPITVSKRSGKIVSGHCRLLAARKLNLKQVPVDYQDFASSEEEYAVLIADNVVQDFAEIDGLKMADILCELDQANYDLALTALDQSQIEDYINGPLYNKPDARADDIPEPPAKPMAKPGDLWQLGKHKLLCGSCLDLDWVSKVTKSKPMLLAITDPPFDLDAFKQAQALRLAGVKTAVVFGGGNEVFRLANLEDYKLRFDFVILYDRPVSLTGNKSLIYRHNRALLLDEDDVGFSSGLVLGREINFDREKWQSVTGTKCSVLEAPVQKDLYRYGKCCDVFRAFVRAMQSDIIYDPFAGSGTGMIACQIENKTWIGMEIEPAICDIAVLRWQNFTGRKAKLA